MAENDVGLRSWQDGQEGLAPELRQTYPLRCESCDRPADENGKIIRHVATEPRPTMDEISDYVLDSVCPATDGCQVEPDGHCDHGHQSWLLRLGLI